MSTSLALLATAALVAAATLPPASARPFEGRIQLRLRDAEPQGADYAIRGDRVRIDVPSVGHAHDLHVVVSTARDLPRASSDVSLRKTGRVRAVVGQLCEEWTLEQGVDVVRACVVPDAAWYDPRRLTGAPVPAWSQRLEVERAFPLSVDVERDGHSVFASWAFEARRETLGDGVFLVPRTARH